MDVPSEQPKKIKGSSEVSEYSKVALQGGHKGIRIYRRKHKLKNFVAGFAVIYHSKYF